MSLHLCSDTVAGNEGEALWKQLDNSLILLCLQAQKIVPFPLKTTEKGGPYVDNSQTEGGNKLIWAGQVERFAWAFSEQWAPYKKVISRNSQPASNRRAIQLPWRTPAPEVVPPANLRRHVRPDLHDRDAEASGTHAGRRTLEASRLRFCALDGPVRGAAAPQSLFHSSRPVGHSSACHRVTALRGLVSISCQWRSSSPRAYMNGPSTVLPRRR